MTFEKLRKGVVILIYTAAVLTPLFYFKQGVYPYVFSKTLLFQTLVEVLFAGYIALAVYDKRYRPHWRSPLTLAALVFLGALIVSAIFGQDVSRSFWSSQERAGGVVLFMHLTALALVMVALFKELNWERLLKFSLGTSLGISTIAFLQLFVPNLLLVENVNNRPGATFGNPTFFAGYLDFHIFIALYFLLQAWRERTRAASKTRAIIFPAVALAVDLIVLFITQTRGDIVGLGIAALVFIGLCVIRPLDFGPALLRKRQVYAGILVALAAFAGIFWFTRTNNAWQHVPGLSRFADVSLSSGGLQPRFLAYRAAWKGFLEKPATGWGWENFNIVYNKFYDPQALEFNYQETRFDKPHNLYLEYLVTGGALLIVAFLAWMIILARRMWQLRNRLLSMVLLTALAAYLVRSAFVFDTIGSLLMLYLFTGIVEGMTLSDASESVPAPKGRFNTGVAWVAIGVSVVAAYLLNIVNLQATYYQYYGYKYFLSNRPARAIESFKQAIATPSPYSWNMKRDYATALAEAYFYNPGKISKEEAADAVKAMQEVGRAHPKDAYNHYSFVDIYNQVSDVNPQEYLPAAEHEAALALELSPNRQEVYFSLAKTKSLESDYAGAIELLKHTIELNPRIPDAHFYYGVIAFANGDQATGYREIHTALDLGRVWKTFYEPRVVGDYFADYDHLDEAIDLYKASLAINEDPEARLKLGIAYYFKDDREQAKENLAKALAETDVTQSISYQSFLPILQDLGLVK